MPQAGHSVAHPSVKERGVLWGEPKKRRIDRGKLNAVV